MRNRPPSRTIEDESVAPSVRLPGRTGACCAQYGARASRASDPGPIAAYPVVPGTLPPTPPFCPAAGRTDVEKTCAPRPIRCLRDVVRSLLRAPDAGLAARVSRERRRCRSWGPEPCASSRLLPKVAEGSTDVRTAEDQQGTRRQRSARGRTDPGSSRAAPTAASGSSASGSCASGSCASGPSNSGPCASGPSAAGRRRA